MIDRYLCIIENNWHIMGELTQNVIRQDAEGISLS